MWIEFDTRYLDHLGMGIGMRRCRSHHANQRNPSDTHRAATNFAALPAANQAFGPDPYALVIIDANAGLAIGILRGANAAVLLDRDARELARVPAPAAPSAIALDPAGDAWIAGELSGTLQRVRARGNELVVIDAIDTGVLGIRALAISPGRIYAAEEVTGRIWAVDLRQDATAPNNHRARPLADCRSPLQLHRVASLLLANCLADRAVRIWQLNNSAATPWATIQHDGPIWAFDARVAGQGLLVATAGVEDHALDRSDGSFGYIDSFATTYHVGRDGAVRRWARINLSELGVITPKWIAWQAGTAGNEITWAATGYGGDKLVTASWIDPRGPPVAVRVGSALPGLRGLAQVGADRFLAANPLIDAWVVLDHGRPQAVPIAEEITRRHARRPKRSPDSTIAERECLVRDEQSTSTLRQATLQLVVAFTDPRLT